MKKLARIMIACVTVVMTVTWVYAQERQSSPSGASVYISSPANGAVVPSTFVVEFGLAGMGVAPAGVPRENTGHHHLLVDGESMPSLSSPLGDVVMHFGGGQTQVQLSLPAGEHTLQLIFADHLHLPHDPPVVSEVVTVTVAE